MEGVPPATLKQFTQKELDVLAALSEMRDKAEADEDACPDDDDSITWEGIQYHYHPTNKGDRVRILFKMQGADPEWFTGTIMEHKQGNLYRVLFREKGRRKQEWDVNLPLGDYPQKWHYENDHSK